MLRSSLVVLTICGCFSCSPRSPQTADPAAPAPAQVDTAEPTGAEPQATDEVGSAPGDVSVSEDKSFQTEVYAASGLPALSEPWGAQQLTSAGQAIAKLANKNRLFLPREGSDKSGAVFAKLVSEENFAALETGDEASRAQAALELTGVVPQYLALYAPIEGSDSSFPREQVRLLGLLLALYPRALAAMGAGGVSEEQLQQQRQIAAAVFDGAEGLLEETTQYRDSDLEILRAAISKHRPILQEQLASKP